MLEVDKKSNSKLNHLEEECFIQLNRLLILKTLNFKEKNLFQVIKLVLLNQNLVLLKIVLIQITLIAVNLIQLKVSSQRNHRITNLVDYFKVKGSYQSELTNAKIVQNHMKMDLYAKKILYIKSAKIVINYFQKDRLLKINVIPVINTFVIGTGSV